MKLNKVIIGALLVTLVSCNDYLEKYPLDAPSSATFGKSKDELTIAINGAYNALHYDAGFGQNVVDYYDGASDLVFNRGGYVVSDAITLGIATPTEGIFSGAWTNYYKAIQRSNFILDNMVAARQTMDATFCDQIEAQAKFLRAWNYLYLTELYGDVPLVTKVLTLAESELPRNPKTEVVAQMLLDLDFAASKLPKAWGGADLGRATSGAALALKARVALYNKNYELAATTAKLVMDLGTYDLHPNYGDLFQVAGNKSKESIFQLQYNLTTTKNMSTIYMGMRSPGFSIICPTQWLVDSYLCTDGKSIDQSPLYDQAKPFENRDPRLKMSILVQGSWFGGVRYENHPDSLTRPRNVGGIIKREANPEATNAYASFTGYLFRKNVDETTMPSPWDGGVMPLNLIRYAEVLLIYVEAKIELNQMDASVYNAINLIRKRAQMPDVPAGMSQDQFRKTLRWERKIELAGEGMRLFDIRRWKIADKVMEGNLPGKKIKDYWYKPGVPTFSEYGHPIYANQATVFKTITARHFDTKKDWLWAIPQKDMDINKKLTQNAGY